MVSREDIDRGGRLADRVDDAIVFIRIETPTFHTVAERIDAARRLLEQSVADNYEAHVSEEDPEDRATIAGWAKDFVNDMRLQDEDETAVVVVDVLNPDLLVKFSDFCSVLDAQNKRPNEGALPSPPAKKAKAKTKQTVEDVPAALRDGITNVLGWATRVDEYERNDLVECKVHAAWHLTRHLDATERLEILGDLREDNESACKDDDGKWKKKKRLKWAVDWIDEMIQNVKTGEPFDDVLRSYSTQRY